MWPPFTAEAPSVDLNVCLSLGLSAPSEETVTALGEQRGSFLPRKTWLLPFVGSQAYSLHILKLSSTVLAQGPGLASRLLTVDY